MRDLRHRGPEAAQVSSELLVAGLVVDRGTSVLRGASSNVCCCCWWSLATTAVKEHVLGGCIVVGAACACASVSPNVQQQLYVGVLDCG